MTGEQLEDEGIMSIDERSSTLFELQGFGMYPTVCGLTMLKAKDCYIIILSEQPQNQGMSVINAFERLATNLKTRHPLLKPVEVDRITWLEHIPENELKDRPEEFSEVRMKWTGTEYTGATFFPLTDHLRKLCCPDYKGD